MRSALLLSAIVSVCLASPTATPVKAIAVLTGSAGVKGTVTLEQVDADDPTVISYNITGQTPNSSRGFHIHVSGDLTNGCASAGAHYNPFKKNHGAPTDEDRHVGDLGNIKTDATGVSIGSVKDENVKLRGPFSVVGRAIVIHGGTDDLGKGASDSDTKKTGNAGARPACGVIGLVV
jgi:Cu-Zn family superoxide dismutase